MQKKVGLHVTQISRLEHGKHNPQASTLATIARACGVSPQWLMFGDGSTYPAVTATTGAPSSDGAPDDHDTRISALEKRVAALEAAMLAVQSALILRGGRPDERP